MITFTIDGKEVSVPEGVSILEAAQLMDIEIPTFCYHEKLSIAGNCRMCLVEVEGSRKSVAACAMPASEGMVVKTTTPFVKTAREGALEFLLINHPLDCPICDQGGECDLQDITLAYGKAEGRYAFQKRAVREKNFGPLIKTAMNRCIHCTRCIRFATEVAGVEDLGAVSRGEHTEIVSYLDQPFASELSGNIIDLCPVGALTSKPFASKGRSWEMKKTPSIDVMDALGSHIRIDARGGEVMRILPRPFEPINEEWLSDKARFAYDGLKVQRLDTPFRRNKKGALKPCTWDEALESVRLKLGSLEPQEMAGLVGDFVDVEAMYLFKRLMDFIKTPHVDCRSDGMKILPEARAHYLLNTPIHRFEEADAALLVGCNPRLEAPLLNARLRKAYTSRNLTVGVCGEGAVLNYPTEQLGGSGEVLGEILKGKHPFSKVFERAKKPLILLGMGALTRRDALSIFNISLEIATKYGLLGLDWCGFNVLQLGASRVGALDLGLLPGQGGKDKEEVFKEAAKGAIKALYLLGEDAVDLSALEKTFVIYQGHHGDQGAKIADIILPGCAYTEKDGLYMNAEGRLQRAFRAVPLPGVAREDWKIFKNVIERLGSKVPENTLEALRASLVKDFPIFKEVGALPKIPETISSLQKGKNGERFLKTPLTSSVQNFYQTDVITRTSATMAQCAETFHGTALRPKKSTGKRI